MLLPSSLETSALSTLDCHLYLLVVVGQKYNVLRIAVRVCNLYSTYHLCPVPSL